LLTHTRDMNVRPAVIPKVPFEWHPCWWRNTGHKM